MLERGTSRGVERRAPVRDHALALHRFVGGVQLVGGLTLAAGYGLGGDSVDLDAAPAVLVVIGLLQLAVGTWWMRRPRDLRAILLTRPGAFVATTLTIAVVVTALGGSARDTIFVTSSMCWLIAAGYALPGYRWAVASAIGCLIPGVVWVLVDGDTGGYGQNGEYLTALIGLAAGVIPGLWLGRTTGKTSSLLNRWHLVEAHERGLVRRLRESLEAVDRAGTAVAERLPDDGDIEVATLRARLAAGLGLREDATDLTLRELLAEIDAEQAAAGGLALRVTGDGVALGLTLPPATAEAVAAVARRQLLNVPRHATRATAITVTARLAGGELALRIEDDGGEPLPDRPGTGTAWSGRQLARVGGAGRYVAGTAGVAYELRVPAAGAVSVSDVPGLSVRDGLERFTTGMLGAMRWAGWTVDSLGAYSERASLGDLWLLMPAAAVVMESIIRWGLPWRRDLSPELRALVASLIVVAVTAAFAWPAGSPDVLITGTSSVVVLTHLIILRRGRWWWAVEVLRLVAVAPLVARDALGSLELVLIYPAAFSLVVVVMRRFVDRATGLERATADAAGRVALGGAAVRGLALRHDAVAVVARTVDAGPELALAVDRLEGALEELALIAAATLDPREAMVAGLQAAVARPVDAESDGAAALRSAVDAATGAIDRVTLIELAALAADERASCTPPGSLGRRRLRTLALRWTTGDGRTALTVEAVPSLHPPEHHAVDRLRSVAESLGVAVHSDDASLTLVFARA